MATTIKVRNVLYHDVCAIDMNERPRDVVAALVQCNSCSAMIYCSRVVCEMGNHQCKRCDIWQYQLGQPSTRKVCIDYDCGAVSNTITTHSCELCKCRLYCNIRYYEHLCKECHAQIGRMPKCGAFNSREYFPCVSTQLIDEIFLHSMTSEALYVQGLSIPREKSDSL